MEIQQISILLTIPLKKEPIPLNLDAIHHPNLKKASGLSNYPYITHKIKYPTKLVQKLTRNGYTEIVNFFFSKTQFEKLLYRYGSEPEEENSTKDMHVILQENVMIMLKLLFPAFYPSFPNVSNSYDEYILQNGTPLSYKLTSNSSYIKIDGKPYTITKTVFLNDLLNHPIYQTVINKYIEYLIWTERQENSIKNELENAKYKLYKRFLDKKGDLNLVEYLNVFINMIETHSSLATSNVPRKMDDDKKLFQETLRPIINNIRQLKDTFGIRDDAGTTPIPPKIDIFAFYEVIGNIKDLYTRLNSYNYMKNKPIEFDTRVNRLFGEIKKIILLEKINNDYIIPKNINVKLQDENEEIVNILRSKYKPYIHFVEFINTIITPRRESSNILLQDSINNYAQNLDSTIKFNNIMNKVYQKYMQSVGEKQNLTSSITDYELQQYMNVGVCMINPDEQDKPHYEIYITMSLIENEYNKDTIAPIKCIYDGLVLGKELEDRFNSANPHQANLHMSIISQNDIQEEQAKPAINPIATKNTKGGKTRRKRNYKKQKRSMRRRTL